MQLLIGKSYLGLDTYSVIDEILWRHPEYAERTIDLYATVTEKMQETITAMHPILFGELRRNRSKFMEPAQRHCRECTSNEAVKVGNIRLLKCVYDKDDKITNMYAMTNAIHNGDVECLQYLYENGNICSQRDIDILGIRGHLKCLQYLSAKIPPESSVSSAYIGPLECLKYLHANKYKYHFEPLIYDDFKDNISTDNCRGAP